MALDNIRERLALHFDAEASLESRVNRDTYEVHIRIPYRTTKSAAAHGGTQATARRDNGAGDDAGKRREPYLRQRVPALAQPRIDHA
jgi:hypothetical protein